MDQRILEFIGDLRRAEMRISPSEALDALSASTEIGLEDGRLYPITRDGGEDVFKSSWVHFAR